MFEKLKVFYSLFHQGQQVANPEFWKGVQSKGQPVIAALLIGLVALLKGTKYELPLSDETAGLIAGGIFAAVNWMLTVITSKKVGLAPSEAAPFEPAATTARLPTNEADMPVVIAPVTQHPDELPGGAYSGVHH